MRFKAYAIKKEDYTSLESFDGEELRRKLNEFRLINDEGCMYGPMYVKREEKLILVTLVQSYYADLKTFSGDSKREVDIDTDMINDRVLFYIDLNQKLIYVQNKRYPSQELKHWKTIERIQTIIEACFSDQKLVLVPVQIKYRIDEINTIFIDSNVREIQFSNLRGIEVPEGTVIHNPMREWDDTFAKSWNRYSKDSLDSVYLKAGRGETLSKNPIARLCLKLAEIGNPNDKKVFKKMVVFANGETEDIRLDGNENKVINIPPENLEDPYDTYDFIIKKNKPGYKDRFDK